MKEEKLSYCKYCKLPKHQCQCVSGEWSVSGLCKKHNDTAGEGFIGCISDEEAKEIRNRIESFKQRFDKDLQNRACQMDWKHDYRFSHYEEDRNMSTTATINGKYAIMICRHCGSYFRQQVMIKAVAKEQ